MAKITHEDYVAQVAERNPTITVLGDYAGSHEPILHRCAKGHEYKAAPNKVKRGSGCKQCLHESLRESPEDYANWLVGNRDDVFMAEPYKGNKVKSLHRCNHGHEWEVMPNSIKQGIGCPTCADIAAHKRNARTTEEYNAELAALGRPFVAIEDYYNNRTSIKHLCDEGHEFVAHPNNVLIGLAGCKVCESLKPLQRFEAWLSEHRPGWKVIAEVKNVCTLTTVRCDHGHEFEVTPATITSGGECPRCSGRRITTEDYSKWLLEDGRGFELVGEYVTASTPTLHKCSEGHEWATSPNNVKNGKGCVMCYAIANNRVVPGTWTEEACVADALQYPTVKAWMDGSSAYASACNKGWLPQCTAHMERSKTAQFDAVYVWEWVVDGEGTGVYKPGLTSFAGGDDRVRRCAGSNKLDYRLLFLLQTGPMEALKIERAILDSGHPIEMPKHVVDGRTEFRYFHPDSKAMATINQLKAIAEGEPIEAQRLVARTANTQQGEANAKTTKRGAGTNP